MESGSAARRSAALDELAEVARLSAEAEHLDVQLVRARAEADRAEEQVSDTALRLTRELADVAALESFSYTRVLASLRGRRQSELEQEQAEARAAEYVHATARARWQSAIDEVNRLLGLRTSLGDLEGRRKRALDAREAEVGTSGPVGGRLGEIAEQVGRLVAHSREVEEAREAARAAEQALSAAAEQLGKAGSWATYDTFFGGGMVADMVKHDRLDEAGALITRADECLKRLGNELADVGVTPVGGIGIDSMTRTLDFWFDNMISDWQVSQRIAAARTRVDEARRQVAQVAGQLVVRTREITDERTALDRERQVLLAG